MRTLYAVIALALVSAADAAPSRLETLSKQTDALVIEINALDRSLQLHLTSFSRQGAATSGSTKKAQALRRRTAALLKRWKTPSAEWKKTSKERSKQFKAQQRWLTDLNKSVLKDRIKIRKEFEKAAAACDLGSISAGIAALCPRGCPSKKLIRGYRLPCALKERKTVLQLPLNRLRLEGGKHRIDIEGGALSLRAHGIYALREPLSRFWTAFYALSIKSTNAKEIEALRRYAGYIREDSPAETIGPAALQRVISVWNLRSHENPDELETDAETTAKRAYFEMSGEAASAIAASSSSGIRSQPSARDAIRRVLRAAGSSRGVSNSDAERLLAANRTTEISGAWPVHSLKASVASLVGSVVGAEVSEDGNVVFSSFKKPYRVVADPAKGSFRVCRDACGENDFLTIDGKPPVAPVVKKDPPKIIIKKKKKKKKKRWWWGGSKDDEEKEEKEPTVVVDPNAPPPQPTWFLIQELQ
ncbi:MAG: hypothetical protein COB53_00510 [Elusimicrobia bacterium]|nr:MAG: hypothetical protein COB53_00510 [Elusimicrobiota bacterium]